MFGQKPSFSEHNVVVLTESLDGILATSNTLQTPQNWGTD
jgi:hypothetical protein